MKILVRGISVLGSGVYIALLMFASQFAGWGDGAGSSRSTPLDFLWGACPLIYFLISFVTTFARRKGCLVLSCGRVAHLFLAGFIVPIFFIGDTGFISLIPSLICTAAWYAMYSGLESATGANEALQATAAWPPS